MHLGRIVPGSILFVSLVAFSAERRPVPPNVVKIVGREYAFDAPDTIPSGWTIFEFRNEGKESHEAILRRVPAGHTAAEALAAATAPGRFPEWLEPAGGPDIIGPDVSTREMQRLEPGTYVWYCFIGAEADAVPHLRKGMIRVMVVTPSGVAAADPQPATKTVIRMADFVFVPSQPIESGVQWLRVENTGAKVHELVILELKPGATLESINKWRRRSGEPRPFTQIGGVAGVQPGQHAYVELNAHPGNYVLRCRIDDEASGKTHRELGMEQEITVEH
jgi:uncharacterized cupredoxin-like copper-binding protein